MALQKASTETDHFAYIVANREHDSPAKTIIGPLRFDACGGLVGRIFALILHFDESARDQVAHVVAPSACPTTECVPLFRRVAELPAVRDLHRNPSEPQIFSRRFAHFSFDKIFVKPLRSLSMQLQQTLAQFSLPLFIVRRAPARFLDNGNPSARGEFAHCRWEISVLIIHHKPEDAPACSAAEAMKRLPAWTYCERRRFLLMKGTERLEIGSRAFQRKI